MYSDVEEIKKGESSVIRDLDTSNPVAVRFSHVDKTYKLYKSDKQRLAGLFSKRVPCELVHANNDLSFTVGRGEGLALLGDNGSGKSTALKMITGVCFPTSGTIEVHGRISALLELSAGFDANLTGMENLRMRCEIWGLSKEEADEYIPEMVEFSEVGTYIDQPLRTYSSGMRARLGFAFASSIHPDILVVDEALSVGDRRFSKKCRARMNKIMGEEDVTVLFVTHSTAQAQEFCQRGIVLNHGNALFEGTIEEAVAYYTDGEEGVAALSSKPKPKKAPVTVKAKAETPMAAVEQPPAKAGDSKLAAQEPAQGGAAQAEQAAPQLQEPADAAQQAAAQTQETPEAPEQMELEASAVPKGAASQVPGEGAGSVEQPVSQEQEAAPSEEAVLGEQDVSTALNETVAQVQEAVATLNQAAPQTPKGDAAPGEGQAPSRVQEALASLEQAVVRMQEVAGALEQDEETALEPEPLPEPEDVSAPIAVEVELSGGKARKKH